MGGVCCSSRDQFPRLKNVTEVENFCFMSECQIKLHQVEFRDFQSAIKRYGYRSDLNDEHMKSIAPEIHLNFNNMKTIPDSAQAICYLDE